MYLPSVLPLHIGPRAFDTLALRTRPYAQCQTMHERAVLHAVLQVENLSAALALHNVVAHLWKWIVDFAYTYSLRIQYENSLVDLMAILALDPRYAQALYSILAGSVTNHTMSTACAKKILRRVRRTSYHFSAS
ncbi:MAG: hypothetical protein H7232_02940 [Aeromicrobium sp.]|nr:hypothetical protein [Burkholderiales bacterium]